MRQFFIEKKYIKENMVLCFDGIMIEKNNNELNQVISFNLEELSNYILEKTSYKVK